MGGTNLKNITSPALFFNPDGDTIILCGWANPARIKKRIEDHDPELLVDVIGIGSQYTESFQYLAHNIHLHGGVKCVIYCSNNPTEKSSQLDKITPIVIRGGEPLKQLTSFSGREIAKDLHGLSRTLFARTLREAFRILKGCIYHTGIPTTINGEAKLLLSNITTMITQPKRSATDYTNQRITDVDYTYPELIDTTAVIAFFKAKPTHGENWVSHLATPQTTHRPCLVLIHWIIDETGRLNATAIFRSHNLSHAWLPNGEFLSNLLCDVAESTDLMVGKLIISDLLLTARVLHISPDWDCEWHKYVEATGVSFINRYQVMDHNGNIYTVDMDINTLIQQGLINTPSHLHFLQRENLL